MWVDRKAPCRKRGRKAYSAQECHYRLFCKIIYTKLEQCTVKLSIEFKFKPFTGTV
jgi:hypothetical protein